MTKVALLSQELINQIAAGEVIERPASVVKELLENALDAGATSITITIEASGLGLIRLSDNGAGMPAADLKLAVLRHATSKLRSLEDLSAIHSLGFRGEALPSIASVSRLRIASRCLDEASGYQLEIEGGQVLHEGPQGLPVGTTVEVRDLFFNTPARLKFMKTAATEQRTIVEVVSRYALARQDVRFVLEAGGRKLLNIASEATASERIQAVLGASLRGQLLNFEKTAPEIAVRGQLASPTVNRPNRSGVYCYVNGRAVRDNQLVAAVIEGYRGQLVSGKYPVALLFLEIDPHEVDVNVHPAKAEVRFSKPSAVFGFIVAAVRQGLNPAGAALEPCASNEPRPLFRPLVDESQAGFGQLREPAPLYSYSKPSPLPPSVPTSQAPLFESRAASYVGLKLVGVFSRSYLLLEDNQALYILDQHAAHERINYERLKRRIAPTQPQQLLSPLLIELGPAELAAGLELTQHLNELGFSLEEFGPTTLALRSLPAGLSAEQARTALSGLIHEFMEGEIRKGRLEDDLLASLACHMSVKAGKDLTETEQLRLLADLEACGAPQTCPHGRPLYKRVSLEEIERWLSRRN